MELNRIGVQANTLNTVRSTRGVQSFKGKIEEPNDKLELSKPKSRTLSDEEKKELLHKSKVTSSGWSSLFGVFSTLYFGLRSDSTIAEKYNLDPNKDKEFIKNIKRQQTIATIPAAIGTLGFGVGSLVSGGAAWLYYKVLEDPKKLSV